MNIGPVPIVAIMLIIGACIVIPSCCRVVDWADRYKEKGVMKRG